MKKIKLTYIGGGSKNWARSFMNDLALQSDLTGEIALYDIDIKAAERNKAIGERINAHPDALSTWEYNVYSELDDALKGADIVAMSILPGTFDEMASDVHAPEKYGIYQSVGDTSGPGGILRAMRTVPIYEGFADAIRRCCPDAWVLNLTNPMTACTMALFETFPEIKAFGCCHEVFHAQDFLCVVAKEVLGIERPDRNEIFTDASGINHFTWITRARYQNIDLLSLLPEFMDRYYETGYYEEPSHQPQDFRDESNPFTYGNKVKMDLYKRFGAMGAAGDRHLVEFMNRNWYLSSPESVKSWLYHLTTVDYRKANQIKQIEKSIALAEGKEPVELKKSGEEAVRIIKALCGLGKLITNTNIQNRGQVPGLRMGAVVETNCIFDADTCEPVISRPLPDPVLSLVSQNSINIDTAFYGIKNRDFHMIFESFVNQPLCAGLPLSDAKELFKTMTLNTSSYLKEYFDMSKLDRI